MNVQDDPAWLAIGAGTMPAMAGGERPLRVGVVGAGRMGSLHARVVHASPAARLSCVIDPDENVGRSLAAEYGSRWLPDVDQDCLVDAFIVASSTETHLHWVEKILAVEKPMLVEKPLSTWLHETRAMVDGATAAGVPLMCGFVERFNAAVLRAKEVLKAPVYLQAIRHGPYTHRVRSGVAYDLAIHDVDIANQLFGEPPDTVSARFGYFRPESSPGAEDVAELHLQFPSGAMAALSASRMAQRKLRTIAVIELGRHLELDLIRQKTVIYCDGAKVVEVPAISAHTEPLVRQFEHFLGLVHGRVDADAEWRSVLPAHEAVAAALAAGPSVTCSAVTDVYAS